MLIFLLFHIIIKKIFNQFLDIKIKTDKVEAVNNLENVDLCFFI